MAAIEKADKLRSNVRLGAPMTVTLNGMVPLKLVTDMAPFSDTVTTKIDCSNTLETK